MRVFKSIIALFLCFSISSFAYDFKACEKKAALSMERVGNTYGIAIEPLGGKSSKAVLFVYSQSKNRADIKC